MGIGIAVTGGKLHGQESACSLGKAVHQTWGEVPVRKQQKHMKSKKVWGTGVGTIMSTKIYACKQYHTNMEEMLKNVRHRFRALLQLPAPGRRRPLGCSSAGRDRAWSRWAPWSIPGSPNRRLLPRRARCSVTTCGAGQREGEPQCPEAAHPTPPDVKLACPGVVLKFLLNNAHTHIREAGYGLGLVP